MGSPARVWCAVGSPVAARAAALWRDGGNSDACTGASAGDSGFRYDFTHLVHPRRIGLVLAVPLRTVVHEPLDSSAVRVRSGASTGSSHVLAGLKPMRRWLRLPRAPSNNGRALCAAQQLLLASPGRTECSRRVAGSHRRRSRGPCVQACRDGTIGVVPASGRSQPKQTWAHQLSRLPSSGLLVSPLERRCADCLRSTLLSSMAI